jgi:hypothetical protein
MNKIPTKRPVGSGLQRHLRRQGYEASNVDLLKPRICFARLITLPLKVPLEPKYSHDLQARVFLTDAPLYGGVLFLVSEVQGYLAHKKHPPPRTLQQRLSRVLWWSYRGVAVAYQ